MRTEILAVLLVGWAPLVVLGALQQLLARRPDPFFLDLTLHVRLLVAAPLLRIAQLALEHQSRRTLSELLEEGFVAASARDRFEAIERRAKRLRNAWLPALVMLALALLVGSATILGWLTPTGVVRGAASTGLSASRAWFGFVALPLFAFLLCRAVWHWAIWILTLGGLARLPLQLEAGHPDRRGGIGFLTLPSLAFHAPFVVAVGSVLSASWGMQILTEGAHLQQFKIAIVAAAALAELLAFGPLLLFTPSLFRAAVAGRSEFGSLATDYARRFRDRWLHGGGREGLLGTLDLQAMDDLSGVYRETVKKMSLLVFGPQAMIGVGVLLLLPMVPLLLADLPFEELLKKLGELVLGTH